VLHRTTQGSTSLLSSFAQLLFKLGIYGKDLNWGGVLAALGDSLMDTEFAGKGIIVPKLTSVTFMPVDGVAELKFLEKGIPAKVDEARAKKVMEEVDVEIVVNLRDDGNIVGKVAEAFYWTCDLMHEFVTINGDFRA
jgi:glutamate N-acetyltransferase/amino-acid N-acetyltransferase